MPLEKFFTGFRKTALETGEIVTAIVIPTPTATHQRFYKIAKRGRDDISTVSVAIALEVNNNVIAGARLGLGRGATALLPGVVGFVARPSTRDARASMQRLPESMRERISTASNAP